MLQYRIYGGRSQAISRRFLVETLLHVIARLCEAISTYDCREGDCFTDRAGANASQSLLAATVIKVKGKGGVLGRRGLPCFALSDHRIDNDQ